MVRAAPSTASGGMMAFTREPSGRRASTMGEASSMRRPTLAVMRSITRRSASSEGKRARVRCRRPSRST